jgi:hypothetical protein
MLGQHRDDDIARMSSSVTPDRGPVRPRRGDEKIDQPGPHPTQICNILFGHPDEHLSEVKNVCFRGPLSILKRVRDATT